MKRNKCFNTRLHVPCISGHNFCAEGHKCGENSECKNWNTKATCECKNGYLSVQGDSAYCEGKQNIQTPVSLSWSGTQYCKPGQWMKSIAECTFMMVNVTETPFMLINMDWSLQVVPDCSSPLSVGVLQRCTCTLAHLGHAVITIGKPVFFSPQTIAATF